MRIGLSQMRCVPGDVAGNIRSVLQTIRRASDDGCQLVVFPEMCDTGYDMPTIVKSASSWDHGPITDIQAAASERSIAVVAGLSERVGPDIFNSLAVIDSNGQLVERYRKIHLITAEPVCEQNYLRPGDRITICRLGGFTIGMLTCYDIRFPELARMLALSGAEMLLVPAAFPMPRIEHWNSLTLARAIENQVYLAAVNRVGQDGGLRFGGSSRFIDPYGTILASARDEEALLIAEATRTRLQEVREGLQVFRDRRDDVYR